MSSSNNNKQFEHFKYKSLNDLKNKIDQLKLEIPIVYSIP